MPMRGTSIDPARPLEQQRITSSVVMPWKWIQVFKDLAHDRRISYSRLVCDILEDYAKRNKIDLPPVA